MMNRLKLPTVLLVCALVLVPHAAFAKRLAGGGSLGKSSPTVAQRATPAQAGSDAAKAAQPAAAQAGAAPQPRSRWGGVLGGLAAGLGLAWLASSLGLGEGFAQVLLWGLLAAAAVWVGAWALRRSRFSGAVRPLGAGLAYQGAGEAVPPKTYSPQNVGNDASARPWERANTGFDAGSSPNPDTPSQRGSVIGSALTGVGGAIPAGFDVAGFLAASKTNFIGLQAAWDRADIPSLRAMMTDGMLAQVKVQLAEHERTAGHNPNVTEVVMLEAHLLGIEQGDGEYTASVEFSGLIREDPSAGPSPFREIWAITRPVAGAAGWLVAGVQALQ